MVVKWGIRLVLLRYRWSNINIMSSFLLRLKDHLLYCYHAKNENNLCGIESIWTHGVFANSYDEQREMMNVKCYVFFCGNCLKFVHGMADVLVFYLYTWKLRVCATMAWRSSSRLIPGTNCSTLLLHFGVCLFVTNGYRSRYPRGLSPPHFTLIYSLVLSKLHGLLLSFRNFLFRSISFSVTKLDGFLF